MTLDPRASALAAYDIGHGGTMTEEFATLFESTMSGTAVAPAVTFDEAVARVRFRVGDTTYRREMLATAVDQVIAVRLTSDRPNAISFTASMSRERDATSRAEGSNAIVLEGQALPASARHADEPRRASTSPASRAFSPKVGRPEQTARR